MKKNLALFGLFVSFCLSPAFSKEIAMAKYSKENHSQSSYEHGDNADWNNPSDMNAISEYSSDDSDSENGGTCSESDSFLQIQIHPKSLPEQIVQSEN